MLSPCKKEINIVSAGFQPQQIAEDRKECGEQSSGKRPGQGLLWQEARLISHSGRCKRRHKSMVCQLWHHTELCECRELAAQISVSGSVRWAALRWGGKANETPQGSLMGGREGKRETNRSKHWNLMKLITVDRISAECIYLFCSFSARDHRAHMEEGNWKKTPSPNRQTFSEPDRSIWAERSKTSAATHQVEFSYFILSRRDFSPTNIKLHLTPLLLHTCWVQSSRRLSLVSGMLGVQVWSRRRLSAGPEHDSLTPPSAQLYPRTYILIKWKQNSPLKSLTYISSMHGGCAPKGCACTVM